MKDLRFEIKKLERVECLKVSVFEGNNGAWWTEVYLRSLRIQANIDFSTWSYNELSRRLNHGRIETTGVRKMDK